MRSCFQNIPHQANVQISIITRTQRAHRALSIHIFYYILCIFFTYFHSKSDSIKMLSFDKMLLRTRRRRSKKSVRFDRNWNTPQTSNNVRALLLPSEMKHERCKLNKMRWKDDDWKQPKKWEENNSGNLYLKNGVYSLHLASLYAINVWQASELSKVGTVMHTKTIEENHINRTAPHEPTNERTHKKANQQE